MVIASLAIRVLAFRINLHGGKKKRDDLGEAFEEQRRLCDFWLTKG
jgi:hypothetical protein